jgi:hypothetical protein
VLLTNPTGTVFSIINTILDLLEEKGEEVFLKILDEEFGGWPILGKSTNSNLVKSNSSLIERLVMLRNLNFRPLFDIYVTLNPKETQLLMLKVSCSF